MKIQRNIIDRLNQWKESKNRKPILLKGARQTGKTWIMLEFGRRYFQQVAVFNFDKVQELSTIFDKTKDVQRILKELALFTDVPIEPGKTLLVFDEIQQCEGALNSLKYFCEDAPEYHVIAAGSLLGVAIRSKRMSVPVGKVELVHVYPVTFKEFLLAADESTYRFVEALNSLVPLPEIMLSKLQLEFKRYLICGGMPEAVNALLENRGIQAVEDTLQNILDLYTLDFSNYAATTDIPRINNLWKSLPSQLAKENRKFIYRIVRSGARAREYEDALLWLEEAGLIHRVFNLSIPGLPFRAYQDIAAFKVYAGDCGLLRRLSGLAPETILSGNSGFTEFKGALTENAVLQSLIPQNEVMPHYWSSENRAEVDFVLQLGSDIVPVEVKSETRISGKSLSIYTNMFKPSIRIRYSMQNLKENDGMLSCPIPLADWTSKLIALAAPTTAQ